jgi:hypothetical protein
MQGALGETYTKPLPISGDGHLMPRSIVPTWDLSLSPSLVDQLSEPDLTSGHLSTTSLARASSAKSRGSSWYASRVTQRLPRGRRSDPVHHP